MSSTVWTVPMNTTDNLQIYVWINSVQVHVKYPVSGCCNSVKPALIAPR